MIGSSSGWGSRCPRSADKMKIYVQQTCTESKIGEDRGNLDGIRPRWKEQELNLDGYKPKQTQFSLSTWVERYVGKAI